MLASVLAGCLPFRSKTTGPPPGPPIDSRTALKPPPPPPPRHLACIQNPRVDLWEYRLRSNADFRVSTHQSIERAQMYLPRLRRIFAQAGVPPSLALLPVIESEFQRSARGRRDDLGLWQFRGETARRFGLVVNDHHDQRLHPYHASRAAARYLHYLHRHYHGDWPLALAAYNAGEHRVDRALARLPNGTFWQLADRGYLPRTSKDYVPRFLAVVRVVEGKQVCRPPQAPTTLANAAAPVVDAAAPVVDPRRGVITQARR